MGKLYFQFATLDDNETSMLVVVNKGHPKVILQSFLVTNLALVEEPLKLARRRSQIHLTHKMAQVILLRANVGQTLYEDQPLRVRVFEQSYGNAPIKRSWRYMRNNL